MHTEEVRRQAALLKTGALQNAILNSANFSSIATDEEGVIQLFNIGAERMLGYDAISRPPRYRTPRSWSRAPSS
jgi:PAS domain-containing protein